MNRFFFLILLNAGWGIPSYSQQQTLNLLAGHPFYDAEPFPSYLMKLNVASKTLDTIRQLSTNKHALREVKYYPEHRKIVLIKDGWFLKNASYKEIEFINMDSLYVIKRINLDSMNYFYMNSWMFFSNPALNESIFGIELYNSKIFNRRALVGFDISTLKSRSFDIDNLKHAQIEGTVGSCLLTFDCLAAYTNPSNGELRIPEAFDTARRPVFSIELPKKMQPTRKELRSIVVNTRNAFVFSLNNSGSGENDLGFTMLAILDKSSSRWFKQKVKGNVDYMIRSFSDWVVGTVYSDLKLFDKKERVREIQNKESPGKEMRRQKIYKTGMPADYRFEYFGVYSPGILYMINVRTENYIEWNTGQGDSEILLVENDEVYYRVNDEIFKASILKGRKLGKAKLLVKNDIVPDIHWAFLSK